VEYCQQHLQGSPVATAWADLGETGQVDALTYALRILEDQTWIGDKVRNDQEYQFPREICPYFSMTRYRKLAQEIQQLLLLSNTLLPESIKLAQCELVMYRLQTAAYESLVTMKNLGLPMTNLGGKMGWQPQPDTKRKLPLPESVWRHCRWWHLWWWSHPVSPKIMRG
jgi:hypothetical protein